MKPKYKEEWKPKLKPKLRDCKEKYEGWKEKMKICHGPKELSKLIPPNDGLPMLSLILNFPYRGTEACSRG